MIYLGFENLHRDYNLKISADVNFEDPLTTPLNPRLNDGLQTLQAYNSLVGSPPVLRVSETKCHYISRHLILGKTSILPLIRGGREDQRVSV